MFSAFTINSFADGVLLTVCIVLLAGLPIFFAAHAMQDVYKTRPILRFFLLLFALGGNILLLLSFTH